MRQARKIASERRAARTRRPVSGGDWRDQLRGAAAGGARGAKAATSALARLGRLVANFWTVRLWPWCRVAGQQLGRGAGATRRYAGSGASAAAAGAHRAAPVLRHVAGAVGRIAGRLGRAAITGARRAWARHARSAWRRLGFVPSFGLGVGLLAGLFSFLARSAHPFAFGWKCGALATVLALGVGLVLHAKSSFLRALESP